MKRFFFFIYIVLICCFLEVGCQRSTAPSSETKVQVSQNLIINGSFDQGNQAPTGWEPIEIRNAGHPENLWKSDPKRGYIAGVELVKPGAGGWKQTITLVPDKHYRIEADIMTENMAGRGIGAALLFPSFRWMRPVFARENSNWTHVESDLINAGFTELDLYCIYGAYGLNTGYGWFDNCIIYEIPIPAMDERITQIAQIGDFDVRVHKEYGYLTSLRPRHGGGDLDYLANYATLPYLKADKDCHLGDIVLDIRSGTEWIRATTLDSDTKRHIEISPVEIRTTANVGPKNHRVKIVSHFTDRGNGEMVWFISLTNISNENCQIGTLELPMHWNTNYCLFDPHDKASQKLLYTRRVSEHKHIAGRSSYEVVCPMDGTPPMLAVCPGDDELTAFEFTYHAVDTIQEQRRDSGSWIHGAWPGLTRICLASGSTVQRYGWSDWLNDHSILRLAPGETRDFSIAFHWMNTRDEIHTVMNQNGHLSARAIPSLAVPINKEGQIIVYGVEKPLEITTSAEWSILETDESMDTDIVRISPVEEGPFSVTLTDATGKSCRLFMVGLPSINTTWTRRCDFIMNRQIFELEGHPLDGAILCYNNRKQSVLAIIDDMWGSGGYEGGVTDGMFMALKNLHQPVKNEIEYLEKYIHEWILGGIQDPSDYGVAWMVSKPQRKERGYNYIHVLNLYAAMTRVAETWQDLTEHSADHYLDLWMQTFNAFRGRGVRFQDLGLMGRGNVTFMPELFRRFGRDNDACAVEAEILKWAEYWSEQPAYPYGSELFFDNTGYETVFFYCDYANRDTLAGQTVEVTEAGRGRAPTWFWHDSDQRWWDAVRTEPEYQTFTDFGENCHHYMTGLNGWMLLEAFDRGYNRHEKALVGYSGILNSLARIQPDGFAGMCYCPDPASDNFGLNQFTGDVGLGLWGSQKAARCYAVMDGDIGMVAYGGDLLEGKESLELYPWSGLGQSVRMIPPGFFMDIDGACVEKMTWNWDSKRIVTVISNPSKYTSHAYIKSGGFAPYSDDVNPYKIDDLKREIMLKPQEKILLETSVNME